MESIKLTTDGGYILGGYSVSNISGDKTENTNGVTDYWVVKTDSTGIIQWQNNIGGNNIEQLSSVIQAFDGGYLLAGTSYSDISGDKTELLNGTHDYWIVKIDSIGNLIWQKSFGGSSGNRTYSLIQLSNGGFLVGGTSNSGLTGNKSENSLGASDFWIIETNSNGDPLWQNTIGGVDSDVFHNFIETSDGGFLLAGRSESNSSSDKDENSMGSADYWIV